MSTDRKKHPILGELNKALKLILLLIFNLCTGGKHAKSYRILSCIRGTFKKMDDPAFRTYILLLLNEQIELIDPCPHLCKKHRENIDLIKKYKDTASVFDLCIMLDYFDSNFNLLSPKRLDDFKVSYEQDGTVTIYPLKRK